MRRTGLILAAALTGLLAGAVRCQAQTQGQAQTQAQTQAQAQAQAQAQDMGAVGRANATAVKVVADTRLPVATPGGHGELPVFVSADWSRPQRSIIRAVIAVHGILRNADVYFHAAEQARDAAGASTETTLLIAPQFLNEVDARDHRLADSVLRWQADRWTGGWPAQGPAPLSSFDGLDAILARLADNRLFPALRQLVVAGHSGGGQVVQRYAVVGRGETALTARNIGVRYVVANPSSYLWFGAERPRPITCEAAYRWKYGPDGAPPYVQPTEGLEARYINRDVVYLLGEADTDPNHPLLDRSCAAEAQGASRLERGMLFDLYLEQRHPNLLRHRIFGIPGVGHDQRRMFGSACGLAALFGTAGCKGL
jgi:pimeloyl-ACP methyl ester carboxylesterase